MSDHEKRLRLSASIAGVIGLASTSFLTIGIIIAGIAGQKWSECGLAAAVAFVSSFLAISALFEIAAAIRSRP
jgi:hypothetical protein